MTMSLASQASADAKLSYLKNLMMNYFTSDPAVRDHMLAAIGTVLQFTPDEQKQIKNAKQQDSTSWFWKCSRDDNFLSLRSTVIYLYDLGLPFSSTIPKLYALSISAFDSCSDVLLLYWMRIDASYCGKEAASRSARHCLTRAVYGFAPIFCIFDRANWKVNNIKDIVPNGGSL